MRVQYDPVKAAANLRKHGVSFADAEGVLADPLAVTIEDPDAQGERRYIAVGSGDLGQVLVVVYSMRADECRLISARRATRKERNAYEG
jgi:uncharacterized protein